MIGVVGCGIEKSLCDAQAMVVEHLKLVKETNDKDCFQVFVQCGATIETFKLPHSESAVDIWSTLLNDAG